MNDELSGFTGIIFNRAGNGGSTVSATGMDLYNSNSVGYHWNDNSATYGWNSGLIVPNNTWSMIAISINANAATAYLCNANGISSATNNVSNPSLSGLNFFIACDPSDKSGRAFNGKIDIAMVYNTTLSGSDINSIFTLQKSSFGL